MATSPQSGSVVLAPLPLNRDTASALVYRPAFKVSREVPHPAFSPDLSDLVVSDREVVAARFDTYTTDGISYMFHCYILDHEDLGMMGQFIVVDE